MPGTYPGRRRIVATKAAIVRHNGPDDPRLPAIDRELEVESVADHIRRVVDAAPPLTDAQRDRLALLLRPAGTVA